MTGRSLHDALLRILTSAALRARLVGPGGASSGESIGDEEAAALRRANPERLRRLARFLGRHFYRERIVRLFAASRRFAREQGRDPLAQLETPAFDSLLETAEVGSAATAERVAALVEARLLEALGERPYGPDLVAYEGTLFRAEAGPRRWRDADGAGEVPVRSPSARIVTLEWDVTTLVTAVRRGEDLLPEPGRTPARLLVALSPDGRVTTVRCGEAVQRLLEALDGTRSVSEVAACAGLGEANAARVLRQLTEVGAVEWRAHSR